MRPLGKCLAYSVILCTAAVMFASAVPAYTPPDPETYVPRMDTVLKQKQSIDDPRPIQKNYGPGAVLPPEFWNHLTHDVQEMKDVWSALVGFKAPEVVGQIAPEITPGKYTLADVKNKPGLNELLIPPLKLRLRNPGPPYVCAIEAFEIIPTRQLYWGLPIAEATRKNKGKAKLDKDGFIIAETWMAGYPFPQPEGKYKARKLIYNHLSKYSNWGGDQAWYIKGFGFNKNLRTESDNSIEVIGLRAHGRVLFEPYGWVSAAAEKRSQKSIAAAVYNSPRDVKGLVWHITTFNDPQTLDQSLMWVPSIRRIRKLSATDTQDSAPGENATMDDTQGFSQKMTPDRYPMKFEITEDREYLTVAFQEIGDEYVDSKDGYAFKNAKLERRPIYTILVTELDKNYVYSKRIIFMDKETFFIPVTDCYDQKDRLYRSIWWHQCFIPKAGIIANVGGYFIAADHVDEQSNFSIEYGIPANYQPGDVSLKGVLKMAK